jgi:hypothetical protein
MKRLLVSVALVLGCAQSGANPTPTAGLTVAKNSNTEFDAIFRNGAAWARVEVKYTPTTTFYRLTTSFNTTLAYQGTAPADPAFVLDPRMDATDGLVVLNQNDKEYAITSRMLDALMARGISATPTLDQKASTMYGGAYTIAEVLGLVMLADPTYYNAQKQVGANDRSGGLRDDGLRTVWPAPGYDDPAMLPPELRVTDGQQNYLNGSCCGPTNCSNCSWPGTKSCDDWCAAGDHCNAHHSGRGCGSVCSAGGCGVWCPHANSGYICAYGNAWNYCSRHQTCGW